VSRHFKPRLKELLALEGFLSSLDFLSETERCRALLITGEIFDNVVSHSGLRPARGARILVSVRKGRRVSILVSFREPGFDAFIAKLPSFKPYYDSAHHRYRGLGLVMCSRLSSKIRYRSGSSSDSILVEL